MEFDEQYYKTEIRGAIDHPHFRQRAEWIKATVPPDSIVYILGCAFGWTVKHLRELGITAYGIESSEYAYSQRVSEYVFHAKAEELPGYFQDAFIFSWNVLDCLNEESATKLAIHLQGFNQCHIVSCSGDYPGYFIRPLAWWKTLFEFFAVFIDHENPISEYHVPTSWGKVSK